MSMMTELADDLDEAIKAEDSVKFHNAYVKLTAACNACHEADGFGFIKISRTAIVANRDLAVQRRDVLGQVRGQGGSLNSRPAGRSRGTPAHASSRPHRDVDGRRPEGGTPKTLRVAQNSAITASGPNGGLRSTRLSNT